MLNALRRLAFPFFLATCALWPAAASADPLVFFLMSAAKQIAAAAVSAAAKPGVAPAAAPATHYPGTVVEPETLRRVINDSFTYLSTDQRDEVFESLNTMLLDPKMGPTRAAMIEYFLHKALAVRVAQVELAKLSYTEKRRLAAQFRQETAGLPDEERKQLVGLLEQQLLPVPADLNELLLAQLQDTGRQ
jgi:hypothetical protein